MDNGPWEKGWTFTVTALDLDGKSKDSIGVTLVDTDGNVHCSMDPIPIASGNIVIKN